MGNSTTFKRNPGRVIFRFPGEEKFNLWEGVWLDGPLNEKEGFILAPFDPSQRKTIFLEPEIKKELHNLEGISLPPIKLNEISEKDIKRLQKSSSKYKDLVFKAIKLLDHKQLKKVVLARSKTTFKVSKPLGLLKKLCLEYPSSFCFMLYKPEDFIWLGASPELLGSWGAERTFKTISLAGTRKISEERNWTEKELEEQKIVTDYISDTIGQAKFQLLEHDGPKASQFGEMEHLKTSFKVGLKEGQDPLDLLGHLHPTPAIGGIPKMEALRFIKQNEGFDRSYYSGYLGPMESQKGNLFVNLRSIQLFQNASVLFAGAGILQGSDPESEFLETELKLNAIEKFLE